MCDRVGLSLSFPRLRPLLPRPPASRSPGIELARTNNKTQTLVPSCRVVYTLFTHRGCALVLPGRSRRGVDAGGHRGAPRGLFAPFLNPTKRTADRTGRLTSSPADVRRAPIALLPPTGLAGPTMTAAETHHSIPPSDRDDRLAGPLARLLGVWVVLVSGLYVLVRKGFGLAERVGATRPMPRRVQWASRPGTGSDRPSLPGPQRVRARRSLCRQGPPTPSILDGLRELNRALVVSRPC